MTEQVRDLLVRTSNPATLDQTMQHFGAAVVEWSPGHYVQEKPGVYIVRCFGDPDYVKFAITQQGYGEVVGERKPSE